MFLAALILVSCEKTPSDVQKSQLAGIWKVSSVTTNGNSSDSPWYYQYKEDGTFEAFAILDTIYFYRNGVYAINGNAVTMSVGKYLYFMNIQKVPRLVYMDKDRVWNKMDILSLSKDEMSTRFAGGDTITFTRVSALPEGWNPEFSQPEIEVTREALIGGWDYVNYFTETQYWYYYQPRLEGITLNENGSLASAYWGQNLIEPYVQLQEGENSYSYTLLWNLDSIATPKKLTTSCSGYTASCKTAEGTYVNEREVALTPPATQNFEVFYFTSSYLVLYDTDQKNWRVLHRTANPIFAPSAAPDSSCPNNTIINNHTNNETESVTRMGNNCAGAITRPVHDLFRGGESAAVME